MDQKELEHFKEKLLQKKAAVIQLVQKAESYGREATTDDDAMDLADKASRSYTKEFLFSMSNSDRQLLQLVGNALERVKNGSFGECLHCEEPIERKRLEAVPWARFCIKCQEVEEQGKL